MHLVLTWKGDPEHYSIPLAEIKDSAKMLDWIFQLRMKTWVTNDIMGDLLTAFQDLYRPQATLCGAGIGKKLNAKKHFDDLLAA